MKTFQCTNCGYVFQGKTGKQCWQCKSRSVVEVSDEEKPSIAPPFKTSQDVHLRSYQLQSKLNQAGLDYVSELTAFKSMIAFNTGEYLKPGLDAVRNLFERECFYFSLRQLLDTPTGDLIPVFDTSKLKESDVTKLIEELKQVVKERYEVLSAHEGQQDLARDITKKIVGDKDDRKTT